MKTMNFKLGLASLLAAALLTSVNAKASDNNADKQKDKVEIKAIASLPVGKIDPVHDDKTNPEETDLWLYRVMNELETGDVKVELDKALNRNVIRCDFYQQKSWYGTYLCYRTKNQEMQRKVYRLTFKAKGTSGNNMKVIIVGNNGKECVITARKSESETPAGYKQINLKKDYTDYALDFDFSQKVKAPYPYPDGNGELGETSDETLTNFFIMFSPNSEFTKFVLDDVKLELKK